MTLRASTTSLSSAHESPPSGERSPARGGAALGAWRTGQTGYRSGRDIARIMVQAGANEQLLQQIADTTAATLPHRRAFGS